MPYTTPDLPYPYDALEPHVDEQTMRIHHDKHHTGYTTKLNAAVENTEFADWDAETLLRKLDSLPADIRTAVRNSGGGHVNHGLFWEIMSPQGGGTPEGRLAEAIAAAFGSYEAFVDEFKAAAAGRFGSGWAWLIVQADGSLAVTSTPNQDNPLSHGATPILGIDVWEHAYYLHYQNRRPEYIDAFFSVINWPAVAARLEAAMN
jgi:Fe-Mn family superoxide dismutase